MVPKAQSVSAGLLTKSEDDSETLLYSGPFESRASATVGCGS